MQTTSQRNKQLNNAQLQVLRTLPQYLYLNQTEFILYNLVDKSSNSGIFKNERLLVLNIRQQTLSYLSKVPNGIIPFYTEEEVDGQVPKERIFQHEIFEDQVNKFTCKELEDKNGIEIKLNKKDKKVEWVFYFKNKDIMKEWYRHIQTVFTKSRAEINEKYHTVPHLQQKNPENDKIIDQNSRDQPSIIKNSRIHSEKEIQPKSPQKQKPPQIEDANQIQSNLSQLKKSPENDKQSSFNEFSQHTPLGSFVRNQSKNHYDSSPQGKNRQPGGIYSTTPKHSQRSIIAPAEKSKDESSYKNLLDELKNKEDSYFKDNEQEDEQLKKSQRSLIRKQFESRSINSRIQQSSRSGSIRKNRPQIMKQYPKHPYQSRRKGQVDDQEDLDNSYKPIQKPLNYRSKSKLIDQNSLKWNKQYYSRHSNNLKIYFTFVKECWSYLHQMIDQLPLSKILQSSQQANNYYIQHCNGIQYKIAHERGTDDSLIYELSEDTPIVSNNYDMFDSLRREFFNEKSIFFRSQSDCPPLIAFFDYRGLPVLCTASDREGIYNKKIRLQKKSTNDIQDLLLEKMESLSLHITSSTDLSNFMHKMNASQLNWAYLYKSTKVAIFKKIFINEMFSEIFHNILRSELCHIYSNFPTEQFDDPNSQLIDEIILDCALMMINRLFGSGKETQVMWSIILKECERRFSTTTSKESILSGYLLYAVISKIGLELNQNVKISNKLMMNDKNATLQKSYVKGFRPIVRTLNYQYMSNVLLQMTQILDKKLSNGDDSERLNTLLSEYKQETPEIIDYLRPQIKLKLTETLPYKSKQANQRQIYDIITCDQPSFENYETAVSAIRWSLASSQVNQASDISFIKIQEILFWIGRIPIICHFYEVMADYYIGNGDYESGIEQVKRSIENLVQIFGLSSLPVLERRNKLCEIYLEINRREDCLKELYECKSICDSSGLKHHPIYLNTLIKISKLALTLSKYNDSINNSLESLKFLQKRAELDNNIQNQENAKQFLEISQLLLRAFELTNRREELFQIGHLCLQRCQNVDSLKTCKRMFKVLFFPYLKRLNLKQSQCLLTLLQELQTICKSSHYSQDELYESIRKKRLMFEINRKIQGYFKNLCVLYDEILKRKILIDFSQRYLESLGQEIIRNQPLSLAVDMFLVGNLIGISYFQALLKDIYYQ